ncbi:MAG: dihydrodipicolinate synthase family protein [Bacteroidales bacterium]
MKIFSHREIFGNWATLLLTTDNKGAIDYSKLCDEIDVLIASRPNGIYCNGTAGEFYTLAEDEFDKIAVLIAVKCSRSEIPYQLGVTHTSPQASLERLKRVRSLEPCAVQVILPDWFPPTLEESIDFLKGVEETAGGISLILYNPPHAKKQLDPEEWAVIRNSVPTLQGLKVFDHNGDTGWYSRVRMNSMGLSVFIPGHRLCTGIKSGAHGSYSNISCLNPFAAQRWYDMIIRDMEAALELESRINEFMTRFIAPLINVHGYSNQACDRFMAVLGGWADVGEYLRWPYKSVPAEYVEAIKYDAKKIIPEFFQTS